MSTQSKMRSISVAFLVLSGIVVNHSPAQTPIAQRSEAVEPSTTVPINAVPAPSSNTADVLDDIWNLLNSVSVRVDTTIDRATEARNNASEARDNAVEMVDNMHDGLQNLTSEMRARIQDAVEELQQALLDELAGATDFTNGPNSCSPECEAFRADLITLLTSIQDVTNALLTLAGITAPADFSNAEIEFIEGLSGKALYPLYRVLGTLPLLSDEFLTSLSQIAENLSEVAPYIDETASARGAALDLCRLLADNDELAGHILTIAKNIDKVGKFAKFAGGVLSAVGKRKINGRVGVWGWVGVSYTGGLLERFGKLLEWLGEHLTPIADKVEKKLQYCVLKVNEEIIIESVDTNHQQFMQNDQAILDALKAIPLPNPADLDGDGVVDLADYSQFQKMLHPGGP